MERSFFLLLNLTSWHHEQFVFDLQRVLEMCLHSSSRHKGTFTFALIRTFQRSSFMESSFIKSDERVQNIYKLCYCASFLNLLNVRLDFLMQKGTGFCRADLRESKSSAFFVYWGYLKKQHMKCDSLQETLTSCHSFCK